MPSPSPRSSPSGEGVPQVQHSDFHYSIPRRQIVLQLVCCVLTIALVSMFIYQLFTAIKADRFLRAWQPCKRSTDRAVSPPPSQKYDIPDLFIYRRTKKTGSSAMLDALPRLLKPYDYVPVYVGGEEANMIVRAESIQQHPRRLFLAKHNAVKKSADPHRRAIIADTFRDGYEQMTSFCRFARGVKECGDELIRCLKSDSALSENRYRWGGQPEEDVDTYIDLPLSSAHPALSTTVLRRVFPNATLELDNYNVANSTCPDIPELRKVYHERYRPLEKQIQRLRKRMLILAGYPTLVETATPGISFAEIIDAAEAREKLKYNLRESQRTTSSNSKSHGQVLRGLRVWTKGENGSIIVVPRYGISP